MSQTIKGYTVLFIPNGKGETKTYQYRGKHKVVISILVGVMIGIISTLGVGVYYKNQLALKYLETVEKQKEQIVTLKTQEQELQGALKVSERTLDEMRLREQTILETALQIKNTQLLVEEAFIGMGGGELSIQDEYIPSFKPCEGYITSPFGTRENPFGGGSEVHKGIDVANSLGTPVYAAASGQVIESRYMNGYGYVIFIDHGNGYETRYAHNSKLLVQEGEYIKKGQMIAKMGSTGNSTGSHLHFELVEEGMRIDPIDLFR